MTEQTQEQVFIVEDDRDIRELLTFNLEKHGYRVIAAATGTEAQELIHKLIPAVVLLDIMLPGVDGLQILREMRHSKGALAKTPVILLSARGEEADIVQGLEIGADDYMTKPFSPKELIARIRSLLRRLRTPEAVVNKSSYAIDVGPVHLDKDRHEVRIRGKNVPFTLAEFRLLEALISKPGRVFTRDQLLERITGGEAFVIDRNVDVHIRAIRKKLDDDADFIMTVRGIGYKCKDYENRAAIQTP